MRYVSSHSIYFKGTDSVARMTCVEAGGAPARDCLQAARVTRGTKLLGIFESKVMHLVATECVW